MIAMQVGAGYLFLSVPATPPTARVTVTDFGAVGDGITDSSAAFLNATEHATWGGEITVPEGIFLTSPINLTSHTRLRVQGEMRGLVATLLILSSSSPHPQNPQLIVTSSSPYLVCHSSELMQIRL